MALTTLDSRTALVPISRGLLGSQQGYSNDRARRFCRGDLVPHGWKIGRSDSGIQQSARVSAL